MSSLRLLRLALACTALLLSACSARVNHFTTEPRHICPGQRVTVKWGVTGSATLTATPQVTGIKNGEVSDEGSTVIEPTASTDIALDVTRFLGSPTGATRTIEVKTTGDKPEALTASVGDSASSPGCEGERKT
ncbi:MAG TPA: hypothetical protein VLT33_07425 [Labilithrix sp.]|nr:hypothetical protein [Labilithrix sp.]